MHTSRLRMNKMKLKSEFLHYFLNILYIFLIIRMVFEGEFIIFQVITFDIASEKWFFNFSKMTGIDCNCLKNTLVLFHIFFVQFFFSPVLLRNYIKKSHIIEGISINYEKPQQIDTKNPVKMVVEMLQSVQLSAFRLTEFPFSKIHKMISSILFVEEKYLSIAFVSSIISKCIYIFFCNRTDTLLPLINVDWMVAFIVLYL